MNEEKFNAESCEVHLARVASVAKEAALDFKLIVESSGRWRIITSARFAYDRRLAGQYGVLYKQDIPTLKALVAQAEETVNKIGKFGKPLNTSDNVNAGVALAMMTGGLSLLFEARKKIHPRTSIKIGSVRSLTFSVVSEEPRRAFVSILMLAPGSRNAAAGVRLDEKGFERLKEVVRLIDSTIEKLGD